MGSDFFIACSKFAGENVEPTELEAAAMQSSLIQQIVVIGQVSILTL